MRFACLGSLVYAQTLPSLTLLHIVTNERLQESKFCSLSLARRTHAQIAKEVFRKIIYFIISCLIFYFFYKSPFMSIRSSSSGSDPPPFLLSSSLPFLLCFNSRWLRSDLSSPPPPHAPLSRCFLLRRLAPPSSTVRRGSSTTSSSSVSPASTVGRRVVQSLPLHQTMEVSPRSLTSNSRTLILNLTSIQVLA